MSQWYVGDLFSVSVGALFFMVMKFCCEISHDSIEHTLFQRISALALISNFSSRMGAYSKEGGNGRGGGAYYVFL